MARLSPPPPVVAPRPIFAHLEAGVCFYRLFDPSRYGTTALSFRSFGPLLRFDHHRGRASGTSTRPADDPERGIYYAASTLSSCLVEVFGDTGIIDVGDWHIARPSATRRLKLLDLREPGAMRAGSIAALSKVPDHAQAQAWSRYFYDSDAYDHCDGLMYYNAHNDEDAFALYERASDALVCPRSSVSRLDSPALISAIAEIAKRHNMGRHPSRVR